MCFVFCLQMDHFQFVFFFHQKIRRICAYPMKIISFKSYAQKCGCIEKENEKVKWKVRASERWVPPIWRGHQIWCTARTQSFTFPSFFALLFSVHNIISPIHRCVLKSCHFLLKAKNEKERGKKPTNKPFGFFFPRKKRSLLLLLFCLNFQKPFKMLPSDPDLD